MHAAVDKLRILLTRPLDDSLRARIDAELPTTWLLQTPDTDDLAIAKANVLYASDRTISAELLANASSLRLVQVAEVDVRPELVRHCHQRSIAVCSASGVFVPTVAEKVIGLMLAHSHGLLAESPDSSLKLSQQKVVILGVGRMGQAIARHCRAFGMQVLGLAHRESWVPYFDDLVTREQLSEAVATADWIIVALPRTEQTEGLVDRSLIEAMKDSASLVCLSHDSVIGPHVEQSPLKQRGNVWVFAEPGGTVVRRVHREAGKGRLIMVPTGFTTNTRDTRAVIDLFLRNLHHLRTGSPLENVIKDSMHQ